MRCAWRELASHIDLWHRPPFLSLFIVLCIANVVLLAIGDPLMPRPPWRSEREWGWWKRYCSITLAEKRRHNQWLRETGRRWIVVVPRLLFAAAVLWFAWPRMISPTYCENFVCKEYEGKLKPRTECLPQNATRWCQIRRV